METISYIQSSYSTEEIACWQLLLCIIPQAVNTVYSSWGWAKLSPETCWADWNY